jgi:hypothetical protein
MGERREEGVQGDTPCHPAQRLPPLRTPLGVSRSIFYLAELLQPLIIYLLEISAILFSFPLSQKWEKGKDYLPAISPKPRLH